METLIGVVVFFAVILFFSAFLTFFEFLDRRWSRFKEGNIFKEKPLFKYWAISIWAICWNGIKNECRYGRLGLPSFQKKERRKD